MSAPPAPEVPRLRDPVLAWILLGALLLRLAVLFVVWPTPLAGDEMDYFWRGAERAQGIEPEDPGFRPPMMELFYGELFRATGASIPAARLANVVLGVALLVPLYLLGLRLGGRRSARLAAALAAAYPNYVAFSHYLWSETAYLLLVLCGLALLVRHVEERSLLRVTLSGVAFGASALTRQVGIAFPLLAAVWLVWRARDALRARPGSALAAPACLLAGACIAIAPWSVHLNRAGEPFALVTRTTGLNLYIGNGEPANGTAPLLHYETLGKTRSERETRARALALRTIVERLPAWPFEKLASELPGFFTPTSFAVRRLQMPPDAAWSLDRAWSYRFRWPALDRPAVRLAGIVVIVGAYLVVVLLGTAGLALLPDSPTRQLGLLFVLSQIAPTVVTFAVSRFRFASMAVFILGAAWLLRTGPGAWRRATTSRRVLAVTATAVVALLIALRWHQLSGHPWA